MFAICDQEETYGTKNCADATSSLKWWMIVLMVLAIIFTCMCCAVTVILAKRQREGDEQDTPKEEHYMEKGEEGALPAPIKITIGVLVGILSIFLIIIIIALLGQSDTDSPKWWVFLLVLFAVDFLMSCCVLAMLAKRNKDDDQGKDGDGKDKVATHLPMPITIGVSVLAAVIIVLLIVIICPINQWNKGTVTMSSSSLVNAVKYSYEVGLFETNLKDTTTINGIDTVYSDITSDNSGKSKDAGEAAFALIMCTIILVGVATMLVVFLFSQIMLIVGIVLTARTTIDSLLT